MKALQHPDELASFVALVRAEGVRSYLEIGCKFGGTFSAVTRSMPAGSHAVAVDLPAGSKDWPASRISLDACVNELKKNGYNTHLIWGNSMDADVIRQVAVLAPFDLVLIDGGHTGDCVRSDWMFYGPMGRIIAFHDIAWHRPPDWGGSYQIDVPMFWERIKENYFHQEIRLDPTGQDNGFGILWRGESEYAIEKQNAGPDYAGGGTSQEVRQASGNSAERRQGLREGGQEEGQEGARPSAGA